MADRPRSGPAIIIPAFNRPHALRRLLTSLLMADIPPGTPLVIVIDCPPPDSPDAGHQAVAELATTVAWPNGEKQVIRQPTHYGLRNNIAFCGDLSATYGTIILLEDDLYVAPSFYRFAAAALDYYAGDPRIAAVSLNSMWLNGITMQPFVPHLDAMDVFFLQLATPQGQAFTAEQWARAAAWLKDHPRPSLEALHPVFADFPETDWLPAADAYLVANNAFYVYPRHSLTTNFGDQGTHIRHKTQIFQVPLQLAERTHRFGAIDESTAVYDAFYECLPDRLCRLAPAMAGYQFDVDLYGSKSNSHMSADYVLTTRRSRSEIMSFGLEMWPMEMNVIAAAAGDDIVLARREDVDSGPAAARDARRRTTAYFNRRHDGRRSDRFSGWLRRGR